MQDSALKPASLRTIMKPISLIFAAVLAFSLPAPAQEPTPTQLSFFNDQVLPILETQCFKCHGAEEKLKGGLRLTSREGLLHGGELGTTLNAENPAASLVLEMISYRDDEHQMPPKSKLSDAEIATLTKWVVEMGAVYDPAKEIHGALVEHGGTHIKEEDFQYWAYKKLETPLVPAANVKSPIDAFVLTALSETGIEPNGRASRQVLARRAFYNLIGLPPTPAEVEKFVADPRPDSEAWAALIDDLLSRPQYGEKWARHWLDLVRYAESNGFERDNPKPLIWRYRDYVINALNEDKPYDQFIIEQLAGDEIAEPTESSLAATGFFRLMQWDDEPADRRQHIYDVHADNVAITTETFLGTTVGCARCHDHKADPITQRDYYSFMAFFHGVTHYQTNGTMVSFAPAEELAKFEAEKTKRVADFNQQLLNLDEELKVFLTETGKIGKGEEMRPQTFVEDARTKPVIWEYVLEEPTQDWKDVGFRDKSWLKAAGGFGTNGTPNAKIGTVWNSGDIWMRTGFGLKDLPESLSLELHHDEEVEVYLNGVEIFTAKGYSRDYEVHLLGEEALNALQTGRNVIAVHCNQTSGGQYIDLALRTSPAKAANLNEALKRGGQKLKAELQKKFGRDVVAERIELRKKMETARRESVGTQINGVQEHANVEPLNVHIRGSAHAPGDLVEPAYLSVLHGSFDPVKAEIVELPEERKSSGRRLTLANWIASPENPLTSRVMANRIWQHHFGRGIVPSSSDFGKLGEDPANQQLLDWLASEFVAQGWSLKKMHRLIMTSEAYQRSSAPNSAGSAQDPTNTKFWRFDMRRLTAEEVRDSLLALSGKLNPKIGGEWVCIPLPQEVLTTQSRPGANWPIKNNDEQYRRSVYVHVKRSLRVPILIDFDQAETDSHCAVRFATTVPTQALGMLNSKFVNDQAAIFADRCQTEGGDSLESQVRFGLGLALQREPAEAEVTESLKLIERLKTEAKLDDELAMDRFALLALNLNAFMYLD
ncbi:MAG: mono/diheme cytochrome c family protein [Verrucomicrobiales bacterium]|jgi:mono/diheme cytochrome c family protein